MMVIMSYSDCSEAEKVNNGDIGADTMLCFMFSDSELQSFPLPTSADSDFSVFK